MSRKSILLGAVLGMTAMMSAPMANAQIASTTSNGLNYADGWAVKAPIDKPRIIITTDPELDDNNSMIRFLLFSTDYDVEGLIYTSSQFHWRGDGKGTLWWVSGREYDRPGLNFKPMTHYRWDEGQQFIDDVVNAYEEAYPNLKVHDSRYPTPEYLRSKVAWGNCDFDGDFSKDTPGSELIKRVLLDDEPGPVFVQAWGGCSTIARALKSIEDIYSQQPGYDELKKKVSQKLVLCLSGDQDNLYTNYIRPYWPDVKQQPTGIGAPSLSFMSAAAAKTDLHKQIYGSEWMNQNILSKGKLGELYPCGAMASNMPRETSTTSSASASEEWSSCVRKDMWCGVHCSPRARSSARATHSAISTSSTTVCTDMCRTGVDGLATNSRVVSSNRTLLRRTCRRYRQVLAPARRQHRLRRSRVVQQRLRPLTSCHQ